ncbi:MAG: glycogen/starch/alpha-glucan phosphorylase [Acidilobus sp.]
MKDVIVSVTPEIALDELYGYAGGLGVLEGDKFYAMSRRGAKYYVITLLYRHGYVDYSFSDDDTPIPKEQEQPINIETVLRPEREFKVKVKGHEIIARPWLYERGNAKVVFIEAVCPIWARRYCEQAYIENNFEENAYKYVFLAKAAATYIRDYIGLDKVRNIDLQEAYTVLVMLALPEFKEYRFITHTPGPWGHPVYPTAMLSEEFGFGYPEPYVVLTKIGMERATITYAVAAKHEEITKKTFPGYAVKISHITNGIDLERWVHPALKQLINAKGLENLTEDDLWATHQQAKKDFLNFIKAYKDVNDEYLERPIVVWLRRNTRYKRPYFIARFIEENNLKDVLFVIGGKAHPRDVDGLSFMREFHKLSKKYPNVVHIHDYDVTKAKVLQTGGDVQTFTPFSGWEASGTSFMKSLANAIPVVSSKDGAVVEVVQHGVNGWLFGEDLRELVNIYTDPKAQEIDEKDYSEFSKYLLEAINIYGTDKYRTMSLSALKTSYKFVDINRALDEFYFKKPEEIEKEPERQKQ